MPFINIYLHVIWSTKNRSKIITRELKPLLIEHIKSNAFLKGIFIDRINCVMDHIHLIISLGSDQTIGKVVQLLKGESSFWINKNKLVKGKFEWQDDYIAVSISKSILDKLRKYVDNQEEHHRIKSYIEEVEEFRKKYGFEDLL
ncbi:IS200/IS605 family transposase [Ignavibacterium sp.]|uniref:IS200/IS605 family transposase n=1 Tax=Ignavibacterium sp. TaxID=2651167 RepID=UPI00307DC8D9